MAEYEGEGEYSGMTAGEALTQYSGEEEVPLQEVISEEEEAVVAASVKSESDEEIDLSSYQEDLTKFKHWLEREPYLPRNVDDEIIITFLYDADSLENAEAKFTNYYYARQSMPKVFHDRHPCNPNNLLRYNSICVIPLTTCLDKKWIIFSVSLYSDSPQKFSIYHVAKLIFIELDILLQENQVRGKTVSVILDMRNFTVEHKDLITRYAAKKVCYLFTDCFPAKFNGFYIINAPDNVAEYTVLFSPLDFHIVEYIEDLPGFLPKKYLPSDLGGDSNKPTSDTLFDPFFKRMRRCGNWLAYEEFLRSQEMMLRMTTTRAEFGFGVLK